MLLAHRLAQDTERAAWGPAYADMGRSLPALLKVDPDAPPVEDHGANEKGEDPA